MDQITDLRELLKHELKDLYSAETQIIDGFPKMIETARNPQLKKAFSEHLKVTRDQKKRLEKIQDILNIENETKEESGGFFANLFKSSEGEQHCKAMEGLIKEGESLMDENMEPDVMDAALIAACQKIEHYEIGSYGTARAYAEQMGMKEVESLLRQTLDEEYFADNSLTKLALEKVNIVAENAGGGLEDEGQKDNSKNNGRQHTTAKNNKNSSSKSVSQSTSSRSVKPAAKSTAPKKSAAKSSSSNTAAKKSSNSNTAGKKSSPKKSSNSKVATKKSAPKKSAAKKSTPKKTAVKKSVAKKSAPKKTALKKSAAKKSTGSRSAVKKSASKKSAPKKSAAKKGAPNKTAVRKSAPKKPMNRGTQVKKSASKKTANKKSSAKKSGRRR